MSPRRFPLLIVLAIVGCTTVHKESAEIPTSWAQQVDEKGKLPVGKVVAIVRWQGRAGAPASASSEIWHGLIGILVVVPIALVTAPAVLAVCGVRDDGCEKPRQHGVTPDAKGNTFRHVVRLVGAREELIRDEHFSYKVGDCVALRHTPDMLVPALGDECNADDLKEAP